VTQDDLSVAAAAIVEAEAAGRYLDELMDALACCFFRVEPRLQARKYVRALMSDLPRKNCWAIAEHAGDASPDRMQRLLERARWDTMAAMGKIRRFVTGHLVSERAVAVLDESGQEKKGTATAGVKRQYVGCAGRVSNAINIVYCSYATPSGHALVGARPYLPAEWAADPDRRDAAGVPANVEFATKPELGAAILADLHADGVLPPWVTGDEVYGRDRRLRAWPEDHATGDIFTNNEAGRSVRPVKVQMRSSGGCWRTLHGLTEFAIVQSYLSTAAKWGIDKLHALRQLFTTGPWLPPALAPPEAALNQAE
jgi:hypothetical protein